MATLIVAPDYVKTQHHKEVRIWLGFRLVAYTNSYERVLCQKNGTAYVPGKVAV